MIYVFGDYELDTHLYELRQAGALRKLEPQVFDILVYLIRHRDRVVTKQELLEKLWPEHYVSDATLYHRLMMARKAIGDSGRAPRLLKTLHGRGYRFSAAIEERDHVMAAAVAPAGTTQGDSADRDKAAQQADTAPQGTSSPALSSVRREEHRVVTILCGTLANAAALVEQRGFDVLPKLQQSLAILVQDTVQHYGGMLQPAGQDDFMALFGVPVAYEDHARRAVLAALALQQSLHEHHPRSGAQPEAGLAVRLGVHTGIVLVGPGGNESHSPLRVLGEALTLAQQLQRVAPPQTLLVSEATWRRLQGDVHGESFGPVQTAAHTAPVMAYAIRALGPWRAPFLQRDGRTLSRFVGRKRELAMLLAALAQSEQGQGQVIGIMGEPGMGKSRLLYEFSQHLAGKPITYVEGQCLSYGEATPYMPLLDIVRQLGGLAYTDSPEVMAARMRQLLAQLGIESTTAVACLLCLLGVSAATEVLAQFSPQAIKAQTFEALRQLSLRRSLQQPLVLAVENLHWIDPTSEAWLSSLVEELANAPLLLLTTYRPGYRPSWMDKSYAAQFALAPLTPHDSRVVVRSALHTHQVPAHLVDEIVSKAAGNPFFLEELTRAVLEHVTTPPTLLVPDTIQAVLNARLDRLPLAAKHLLQLAAVIGKDVPFTLLQGIADLPTDVLEDTVRQLQMAEFLYESHRGPDRAYTFKHALTQEAAYQSLLHRTRQQIHGRIAHTLTVRLPDIVGTQPELLAQHYTAAGLDEPAVPYWYTAGRNASERSAYVEAMRHFTKGLDLLSTLPTTPERAEQELDFHLALGASLIAVKGYGAPEVEQNYLRARELCQKAGETPQRFLVLQGLWNGYLLRGELHTAQALADQLLGLAQKRQDPALLVGACRALGTTLFYLGQFPAAREHLERGITLDNPQQHRPLALLYGADPGIICRCYAAVVLWFLGFADQARQMVDAAFTLAQERSHPFSLAMALNNVAWIHQFRGEAWSVQEWAEAERALATEYGFPQFVAQGQILRGWALAMQGQAQEGTVQISQGLDVWHTTGAKVSRPYFLTQLVEACAQEGHIAAGLRLLAEAQVAVDEMGEGWWAAELYRLRGELLLVQEDTRQPWLEAEACFQQALAMTQHQQAKSLELRSAMSLSRLWQRQGRQQEAGALLAPIYNWFTEGFETADLQEARALLEQLPAP